MNKIWENLWSFSGLSVGIGATGGVSAMVTMFVDINGSVSVKWIILTVWLFVVLSAILLKTVYDFSKLKDPEEPYAYPIKSYPNEKMFIIRKTDAFVRDIVVGCYVVDNDIERLAYVGLVHLVQDKIIQVRALRDLGICEKFPTTKPQLSSLIVRSVVPFTALKSLEGITDE